MSNKSIGILNTSSPFNSSHAKDSLDVALIMGSFEQETHLYFQGDAVFQLIHQDPEPIHVKNFMKTFSAFTFYDLEHVYVCKKSLEERNLPLDNFHLDDITLLDTVEFQQSLSQHKIIFRF